jgi:cytochrome b
MGGLVETMHERVADPTVYQPSEKVKGQKMTTKILIWDLPTRAFHVLLAVGFIVCLSIAQFAGEHSPLFPYHMMLGIVLGIMLVLRLIWGFVGTRYARFNALHLSPVALVQYLMSALTARGPRYTGHNPASSYAIVAMLVLLGVIVTTGILMTRGFEAAEELHGVFAYALLAVAVVHVLGVAWYSIRHRENISRSMITGFKQGLPEDAITSSRPVVAVAFLALMAVVTIGLLQNYDPAKRQTRVPVVGAVIHLAESESH